MYRRFQYETTFVNQYYIEKARKFQDGNKEAIRQSLSSYLRDNATLDGTMMMNDCFPQIECDVFISHAHADEKVALTFAGRLWSELGLKSFIDSGVWSNVDDLLDEFEEKFYHKDSTITDYQGGRNFYASHVNMMLANSLTKMIDKTECLFFLNTPNSLFVQNCDMMTLSPWIHYELTTCKYIRINCPERHKPKILSERTDSIPKQATYKKPVSYRLDLSSLTKVTESFIDMWINDSKDRRLNPSEALDDLYNRAFRHNLSRISNFPYLFLKP